MLKQKFRKFTFVKVADELPANMSHFDKGFMGIVKGSYSQLYGTEDIKNYALFVLKNGVIVNEISWYPEEILTLVPYQDRGFAEELLEDYRFGKVKSVVFNADSYVIDKHSRPNDTGWTKVYHAGVMNAFSFQKEGCNAIKISGKVYAAKAYPGYDDPHFMVNFNALLKV